MHEENLIKYYNKFNEDKRLTRKHGTIEFITSMKYIKEYLKPNSCILDIGAGTGKYSIALAEMGHDVTALELVKHNLRVIEKNSCLVKAIQGNATNLSRFNDNEFDMVLLFGPMYHLCNDLDKIKALNEAKRVLKDDGILLVAYCMNEYAIIKHGFMEDAILESTDRIDDTYHIRSKETDLYSYVRLEDINYFNEKTGLKRIKIINTDGPANYIRHILNKMDENTFNEFINYHLSTCERSDLIGAGAHTLDILKK